MADTDAGGKAMSEYAKRDTESQGEHYMRHLDAMTREGLHSKSDIAAELAHRDIELEELRGATQWTKTSDALPNVGECVLVCKLAPNGNVQWWGLARRLTNAWENLNWHRDIPLADVDCWQRVRLPGSSIAAALGEVGK